MFVKEFQLTANQRTRIVRPGRFFMILEAAGEISVGFESNGSESGEVAEAVQAGYKRFPGDWANPEAGKFTAAVLTSATTQTVKIGISDNAADYARVVGVVTVNQPISLLDFVDVALTTSLTTLTASADQRAVIIQNLGANNVRLGSNLITATRGIQLVPGATLILDLNFTLLARTEAGASTISWTRINT